MRSKLENQIQKDLAGPPSRPLPEDPFEGFRVHDGPCNHSRPIEHLCNTDAANRKRLFDPFCTCGRSASCDVHPAGRPVSYMGKGHVNRTAVQRNIDRRAKRKLKALVQACADLHHRGK